MDVIETNQNYHSLLKDYDQTRAKQDRVVLCHAPFTNMNFEQNGNVTACCYNRKLVLGQYPNLSLKEIWNSENAIEMREAIKNRDLSKGCHLCANQILSRNFYGTRARYFDTFVNHTKVQLDGRGPQILEFELSNICNLECAMCNGYFSSLIRRNREKLPPLENPYDDSFVEQLRDFIPGLKWARFLGGEPFLNPLYYKIWKLIAELNPNVNVVITTNGTVMNDKVRWVLANVKPMIVLSLDSMKKESYETIRKNAVFENTMENLHTYIKYVRFAERTLDLAICPMTLNWEEIPEIVNFGVRNTVQVNFNTVLEPKDLSLKYLSKAKLDEILKNYRNASILEWKDLWDDPPPWPKTVAQNNRNNFQSLVNQIEAWRAE